MNYKTVPIALVFLFFSCKINKHEVVSSRLQDAKKNIKNFQSQELIHWKSERDSILQLEDLNKNKNDITFRISEEFDDNRTGIVFIFSQNKDHWTGKYLTYGMSRPIVLLGKYNIPDPKSGWKAFIDKLLNLGIVEMPDYSTLEDYQTGTDENISFFEIADKENYRYYNYLSPRSFSNKEAKNIVKILDLIYIEFGISYNEISTRKY